VVAVLKVSGGERPEHLAQTFTDACTTDGEAYGLLVDTLKTFRPPKAGEDGVFELGFSPGIRLEPPGGQGRTRLLKRPRLNDEKDPTGFVGYPPDGIETEVLFKDVGPAQLGKVLADPPFNMPPDRVKDLVRTATSEANKDSR
jgi:hypothetical protein